MAFLYNPSVINSGGDEIPEMKIYPEAADQTYLKGELVQLVAGAVTEAAASAPAVIGIAQKDASGTTATDAPVILIKPEYIVRMRFSDGSAAALTSTGVLGAAYDIVLISNAWYVDQSVLNDDKVVLLGHIPDEVGTATYWAEVRFLDSVCQYSTGSAES